MGCDEQTGEALMSDTNGSSGPEITPSRQRRVEAGLLAVQEVEQERDECRREYEELETMHRGLSSEHDALKLAYARMQTEVDTYRRDRDEAVTRLAGFEAVFEACLTIMQKHRGGIQKDAAAIPKDRA
jgi:chromosome segregation ATPase